MSTYDLKEFQYPTYIDDIGYKHGIYRLPGESVYNFKIRLLNITKDDPKVDEAWFHKHVSGFVGVPLVNIFRIELVYDGDEPLAADPYVEIINDQLNLYSEFANNVIDLSLDISEYGSYKFIQNVVDEINNSDYFSVTHYNDAYAFKKSCFLLKGNTNRFITYESVRGSKSNRLKHGLIKDIYPNSSEFLIEKNSLDLINEAGDYYIDYINGVVFTYDDFQGNISYSYSQFPYDCFYSNVNAISLQDSGIASLIQNSTTDNLFAIKYTGISSKGEEILAELYKVAPYFWK